MIPLFTLNNLILFLSLGVLKVGIYWLSTNVNCHCLYWAAGLSLPPYPAFFLITKLMYLLATTKITLGVNKEKVNIFLSPWFSPFSSYTHWGSQQ